MGQEASSSCSYNLTDFLIRQKNIFFIKYAENKKQYYVKKTCLLVIKHIPWNILKKKNVDCYLYVFFLEQLGNLNLIVIFISYAQNKQNNEVKYKKKIG